MVQTTACEADESHRFPRGKRIRQLNTKKGVVRRSCGEVWLEAPGSSIWIAKPL